MCILLNHRSIFVSRHGGLTTDQSIKLYKWEIWDRGTDWTFHNSRPNNSSLGAINPKNPGMTRWNNNGTLFFITLTNDLCGHAVNALDCQSLEFDGASSNHTRCYIFSISEFSIMTRNPFIICNYADINHDFNYLLH